MTLHKVKWVPLTALLLVTNMTLASSSVQFAGQAQGGVYHINNESNWLDPWLDNGTGLLRYDDGSQLRFDHALLDVNWELGVTTSFKSTLQYNLDGDDRFGLSEAYIESKPISQFYKHQFKIGYFYPEFSLENASIGWTSPYTFNFSAINSWVAEEVRPLGIEWQFSRPGRIHGSKHSYTLVASAYQQNDGLASLLSWRGWAVHQRQSSIGEKVHFADYFQFMPVDNPNPTYVDINTETDGHIGYYVGSHYQYLRQTDVRFYIYDNLASPFGLEPDMQYSWRTKFVSVSALHKFSKSSRVLFQYMDGSTEMGDRIKGVHNDFKALYLLLHHSRKMGGLKHRFSVRYDYFEVTDKDDNMFDPNDSSGNNITLSWRQILNSGVQIGVEVSRIDSENSNRALWASWPPKQAQVSLAGIVQYNF